MISNCLFWNLCRKYLVARDGVKEGRDALVEKVEEHGEVNDDRTAECFDVVLLKDVQYLTKNKLEILMDFSERRMNLACNGYWRICTEGRRFVVNDDDEGFLSFGH